MNAYIELAGKRYKTLASQWEPIVEKPATVRYAWDQTLDVTYGPSSFTGWTGVIEASVLPNANYGTPAELMATLLTQGEILYRDHYGGQYYVHAVGPFKQRSLLNVWDSPRNKLFVSAKLVKARDYAAS